jgi:hypothetical protein
MIGSCLNEYFAAVKCEYEEESEKLYKFDNDNTGGSLHVCGYVVSANEDVVSAIFGFYLYLARISGTKNSVMRRKTRV